ncbi:receptor-like protein kinase 1 [Striga hermonthica]|uniref:Receptor-like protein kinase 1 n=1 Tax=Striga hermonthica TaxID=68872 RepID=A0A9N7N3Y0_STRHE|nr:receptor-like protein kinase 1 [Striga hermonthica]
MEPHLILLFITSTLFPFLTLSQPTGKITLGASICANDTSPPWLSPSKEFAFGFQPLSKNNNSSYYVLSIWFDKIPPKTIVCTVILRSTLPAADYYFRATIDFDGVFSLYHYPKKFDRNSKWEISSGGTLPENVCLAITGDKGSGACGYNNVCSLKDGRPVCRCPDGFVLVDPENEYGDCRANFSGDCLGRAGPGRYRLVTVRDVDWPLNDYQQINPSTQEECRDGCLNDYLCGAAIFRSNSCWRKRLPLSNGRVDTSLGASAFLKVRR